MRSLTSLRTKLTVLLAIPLTVLVTASALNLWHASDTARDRRSAVERIELSVAATTAARQLAQERALSASTLAHPSDSSVPDDLAFQRDRTSEAVGELQSVIAADDATPPDADPALAGLRSLTVTRQDVDRGTTSSDQVLGAYGQIIDPVLQLGPADRAADDLALTRSLDAFGALSRGIQEVALEEGLVSSVLASGTIGTDVYQRLLAAVANQGVWFDLFRRNATPAQLDSFDEAEAVADTGSAQGARATAVAAGPGGAVEGNPEVWSSAMGRKLDLLDSLADDSGADLADAAAARSNAAAGHRTTSLVLLVVAALGAAGLVLGVHRVIGERLGRLAGATGRAATDGVADVVEIAQAEGAEAARRALRPMPRSGATELDQIAAGVDALQATAIDLAAEGAVLRGNVHSVFLNFGTRTQNLVTRQLGHIDDLEARTDDPDTLSDLFLLDHLATRLRRNAESMVVMAGADSPRPWARPVSVVNVVRAAAAEATDYSRVDVEQMAPAAVLGTTANDVSHLLAELLDNALAFSPSESRVTVAGAWHHDGRYLVTVSDAGMGMSAAQLGEANRRIAELPLVESAISGYFGLFVVGRFAYRHGIEVRLVPSPTDGVTAEVLLPDTLLAGPQHAPALPALGPAPTASAATTPVETPTAMAFVPGDEGGRNHAGAAPATNGGRAGAHAAAPVPLVPAPSGHDDRSPRDEDEHTAQPRWRRRRARRPAGTRDGVTPPAISPAASPTTVGRSDD